MAVDTPNPTCSSSHTKTDTETPTALAVEPSAGASLDKKEQGAQGDARNRSNAAATDDDDKDVREITEVRSLLICLALYISALMYGLDTTIAADVQGAVISTFEDVTKLAWIGAGFPLGSLYIAGIVPFQGGSSLYGAAPTMSALIVGRVFTGTGFVWGLGAILGPVGGGGFSVSPATWRWGFYINLIIGAVTAPIHLFCLPSIDPARGKSLRERAGSRDYLGFVLSAGICFPGHLLRSRTQVLLYVTTSAANAVMFVTIFYIPVYFQFTQNDDSLMAAVRLLPYLILLITVNLATGWVLPKESFSILMGIGTGITMQLGYAVASLKVPRPVDIFGAINMQNIAQIGSTVIFLVIAGQVFQSTAVHNLNIVLAGQSFSQEQIKDMVAGTQSERPSFVIPLVAGIVSTISALLMKRERLFS
ncbi:hypothetical protein VTG60DRAFT_2561 [Thermothelomyces hinnuleus]